MHNSFVHKGQHPLKGFTSYRGSTPCGYFVSSLADSESRNISQGPVVEKHPTLFHSRGFTLIELLVVISIISLLSSVVFASVNGARAKARDAKRVADFKQIQTALEFFYDSQGRYPITGGGPTWDEHWQLFTTCLETGNGCGFTTSGFTPVISRVPQDPLDASGFSDGDPTYYTGWEGRTEQNYILRTQLETNSSALQNDADGGWRGSTDGGCNDPWYCVKQNWPW